MKNSFQVKQVLENIVVPEGYVMISYDVKALFTSIPQNLAIESLKYLSLHNEEWKNKTSLNLEDLIDLSKICLDSTIFSWDNQLYQQIKGTPMGSSVSVALSECTMQYIEKFIFENSSLNIKTWVRQLDDIYAIVPADKKRNF